MPDLEDQLRTYYEATTEPIEVDSITVDPGTVIVGPFPEAAQRRSTMTAPTKPRETRPRWKNAWAAAAAFVAIVVTVGALAVVNLADDTTSADRTTVVFNGTECDYTGPDLFVAGSPATFEFLNTTDTASGLSFWKVPDGTENDSVVTRAELTTFPRPSGYAEYGNLRLVAQRGMQVTSELEFTLAGTHMMNCFVFDATPTTPRTGLLPVFFDVVEE